MSSLPSPCRRSDAGVPHSGRGVRERPGVANLLMLLAALRNESADKICLEFEGSGAAALKECVTEAAVHVIMPIREELRRLRAERDEVVRVLKDGEEQAAAIAEETMKQVRSMVGLV